jgi:hypothetical protein
LRDAGDRDAGGPLGGLGRGRDAEVVECRGEQLDLTQCVRAGKQDDVVAAGLVEPFELAVDLRTARDRIGACGGEVVRSVVVGEVVVGGPVGVASQTEVALGDQ